MSVVQCLVTLLRTGIGGPVFGGSIPEVLWLEKPHRQLVLVVRWLEMLYQRQMLADQWPKIPHCN